MKSNANLKSTTLFIALALSTGSLQAYAFGTADDVDETVYTTAFKALDTDNDGTLTRSEAKKEKLFARRFSAADKDHNGTLDQQEYTNYRTQAEQKNAKRVVSDSVITSKVKGKLLKDEGLKSLKVSVETHQGVVLLSGFVATEDQIQQAGKIAAETEGVKSVKNSLVLKKD
ncbi:MAG TPA: BON domain-containing protein [Methylophilaceae bacterium]|nr:BON domain-containing protein [Methylophilaceae bacterium]